MVSRAAPDPAVVVTVAWPYEVVPDPWCPVTVDGRTVGAVTAVHRSAAGVELELAITDPETTRLTLEGTL